MELDLIWKVFLEGLSGREAIRKASYKKFAGIPFLYLEAGEGYGQKELNQEIRINSSAAMKGKQLHSETIFVRAAPPIFIYRHRFYVPQRKMFCCGNQCADCIRFSQTAGW